MEHVIITKNARETIGRGGKFLKEALKSSEEDRPLIFYIEGELGSGKTHFIKGMAKELGLNSVKSPTFVVMKKFVIVSSTQDNSKKGKKFFFHIDCYRISGSDDAKQISLDKAMQNPRAIVAIEWAERIKKVVPRPYWELKFEHISKNERKITISKVE